MKFIDQSFNDPRWHNVSAIEINKLIELIQNKDVFEIVLLFWFFIIGFVFYNYSLKQKFLNYRAWTPASSILIKIFIHNCFHFVLMYVQWMI